MLKESTPVPGAACPAGTVQTSGSIPGTGGYYLFCLPQSGWNGSLVVYAHGYIPPQLPLEIHDDVVGGLTVSQIATSLGYAFATTSYRSNGLVVPEATHDLQRVVSLFREVYGPLSGEVYGVGVSEGGLIATLATERQPQLFDGTLALCGPVGSFTQQVAYLGDVRVLFDYFFPGVIPGDLVNVPPSATAAFGTASQPGPLALAILLAMGADPVATASFLQAAGINVAPAQIGPTVLTLLAYDILGFPQIEAILGGNPYDNTARIYPAPVNNALVRRYTADQPAVSHLNALYETSGRLRIPLVTLHNLLDPIVPFAQEPAYTAKVQVAGASQLLTQLQAQDPMGHCNFALQEVQGAFALLVSQVGAQSATALR
jgi:pimeloyl-ACP methyl ester carboxylesterase